MKKETKKFFRESTYLWKMEDSYRRINQDLEKTSFCISTTCELAVYSNRREAKYLFPYEIFVIVEGEFEQSTMKACKINLTIEYFSSFHDDLSASEQAVLDQIEQIAKTYGLQELK